jgi:hypothetical protein
MDALRAENAELKAALARVTQQLEGFQRQLFGRKSERRLPVDPSQGNLLADLATAPPLLAAFPTAHHHRKYLHRLRGKYPRVSVGAYTYTRRTSQNRGDAVRNSGLRFDACSSRSARRSSNTSVRSG